MLNKLFKFGQSYEKFLKMLLFVEHLGNFVAVNGAILSNEELKKRVEYSP